MAKEQSKDSTELPASKVLAALHAVMEKVGYVQKRGHNAFHKYNYAGEGDLLEVLRPAMVEAGLLLIPNVTHVSGVDEYGNVNVTIEYTLAHKDGEVWNEKVTVIGTGNDRHRNGGVGDKGTYKAMTGANKYLLFKLFQIETGDDPEKKEVEEAPANKQSGGNRIHGPLNITELKKKMREFAGDLARVGDPDELVALLYSYQEITEQCARDLVDWWEREDGSGAKQRIEARRKELESNAALAPRINDPAMQGPTA